MFMRYAGGGVGHTTPVSAVGADGHVMDVDEDEDNVTYDNVSMSGSDSDEDEEDESEDDQWDDDEDNLGPEDGEGANDSNEFEYYDDL